jgi:hypothetical protein
MTTNWRPSTRSDRADRPDHQRPTGGGRGDRGADGDRACRGAHRSPYAASTPRQLGRVVGVAKSVSEDLAPLNPPPHGIVLDLTLPDGSKRLAERKAVDMGHAGPLDRPPSPGSPRPHNMRPGAILLPRRSSNTLCTEASGVGCLHDGHQATHAPRHNKQLSIA